MKKPCKGYSKVERAHRKYVAIYLSYIGLMIIILNLANLGILTYPLEATAFLTTSFFIWFLAYRPYEDKLHNVG